MVQNLHRLLVFVDAIFREVTKTHHLRENAAPRMAITCSIKFEFHFKIGAISPPPNLPLGGRNSPDFFQALSRRSAICSCERFLQLLWKSSLLVGIEPTTL